MDVVNATSTTPNENGDAQLHHQGPTSLKDTAWIDRNAIELHTSFEAMSGQTLRERCGELILYSQAAPDQTLAV